MRKRIQNAQNSFTHKRTSSDAGLVFSYEKEELKRLWISRYHDIEKKLSKLKREWNKFETEAHSTYQQWYHRTFAQTLSEIRALTEVSQEYRQIFSAIESQIKINGLTRSAAFHHVSEKMKLKEDPFPSEEEVRLFREKEQQEFQDEFRRAHRSGSSEEIDSELLEKARVMIYALAKKQYQHGPRNAHEARLMSEAIEEAIHTLYEKMKLAKEMGISPSDFMLDKHGDLNQAEEWEQEGDRRDEVNTNDEDLSENEEDKTPPHSSTHAIEDYKVLYRKIVRLLHPDRGSEMSKDESQLWNEAQRAYQSKDREGLKTILLRIEGGGFVPVHLLESVGEVMDVVLTLHFEFREMNYHKNHVRKGAVYRFWASRTRDQNREKLRQGLEKELSQQLYWIKQDLQDLITEMNWLKKQVKQGATKRARK